MDAKKYLSEILGYYKYKVDNNLCTMEEIESASKALSENIKAYGSISDIAKYFDEPENNVRAAINRRLVDKPKRKLLYPFHKFLEIVPDKWRSK